MVRWQLAEFLMLMPLLSGKKSAAQPAMMPPAIGTNHELPNQPASAAWPAPVMMRPVVKHVEHRPMIVASVLPPTLVIWPHRSKSATGRLWFVRYQHTKTSVAWVSLAARLDAVPATMAG